MKILFGGEFEIGKIFEIENCKCSNVSILEKGEMPYVGATNRNNGVLKFVKAVPRLITKGNCIAFICDGEGSVGFSIYKEEDFIGSTTVKVGRNENINKYSASFIVTMADTVRSKYNFGFKRNELHLKKEKILLPVNFAKEPDFDFMENFMRQKENAKIKQFNKFVSMKLLKLNGFKKVNSLQNVQWKEFFLNEIFQDIQRGRRLRKKDHKSGQTPYVSSTALNNGIDGFVGNKMNVRMFKNCLTIANSGSVGASFYQPYSFIASDHITKLANDNFNEFVYLFMSCMTQRLGEKYSFNREINDKRIQKEKILLPIDEKGNPDYYFMQNYMKQLQLKKLQMFQKIKGF